MFMACVMAKGPWTEENTVAHFVSSKQVAARSVIYAIKDIVEAVRNAFVNPP